MGKTVAVTLFLFLSCAQSSDTPEALLRALYDDHKPQQESGVDPDDQAQIARYFTPEMAALFARNSECEERTKEICNLGFDPIFAAQDNGNEPLDLAIEPLSESRFKVTFTNITRRSLIYEVAKTKAGWRVSDIVYPEGGTLREILSQPVS